MTVLNLQTPIGSNFLKDFPQQNAVNCELEDAYAGPCLITDPIQTYTPQLTASVTNPVQGAGGTLFGRYYRIFDQIVTWGEFRFGASGFNVGSGIYRISLPFPAKSLVASGNPYSTYIPVGIGVTFQVASVSGRMPLVVNLGSPDFLVFTLKQAAGSREMTNAFPYVPVTGSPGDGFMWSARYQRLP